MHKDYCNSKCSHLQFFSENVNAIGLQGEKLHLVLHSTKTKEDKRRQKKTLKPKACRVDSFETYLIGLDKN